MVLATHPVPARYRQPLLGAPDPRLRRALLVAGSLGLAWAVLVLVVPVPEPHERRVEELPERLARLIVDEPPAPPVVEPPAPRSVPRAEVPPAPSPPRAETTPEPVPEALPEQRRPRRAPDPQLPTDRGEAGRQRARTEVTRELAKVRDEVDETLASLSEILPATEAEGGTEPAPRRRGGRSLRAGRDASGMAAADTRRTTGARGLDRSTLRAGVSDLGALGTFDLAGVEGDAGAVGGPGAPAPSSDTGDRSSSSLMDVVRRYAPGIRYCYDTALEQDRSLRGKMVFRITVAADGSVSGVEVVDDTLGSAEVEDCARAQIEAWRFGRAAAASVFDAPFVFRPRS